MELSRIRTVSAGWPFPRLIAGLQDVEYVTAGFSHNLAVDRAGKAFVWGDHEALGLQDLDESQTTPLNIPNLRVMVPCG